MKDPEQTWIEATIQFIDADEEKRLDFVARCTENGALGGAEDPSSSPQAPETSTGCRACGSAVLYSVFFPGSMGMETVLNVLENRVSAFCHASPGAGGKVLRCRVIEKQAWSTGWMHAFAPERVADRLWTVPPWEQSPMLPAGGIGIVIEPGLAFGTGKHATTRHCLTFLEEIASVRGGVLAGRFLDAGCGSAILSVAAALMGAERVLAVEVDPDAIPTARKTLERNGLLKRVWLVNGPLECCRGRFDLVAANLTAPVLSDYAQTLASSLDPAGLCIAAGILLAERPAILERFRAFGLIGLRERLDEEEGWCTLLLQKGPSL